MDADLWAARLSAAKRHHHSLYQQQFDRLSVDDFEADDEVRPEFACPYCCEDFDISSLCTHIEEEHLFESKGVVCPVCAARVPKDIIAHMTLQHGHLFKIQRRRRFRRGGLPTGATLSLLGKDYREAHLQALLGNGAFGSNGGSLNSMMDSLLSALANSFPISESENSTRQNVYMNDNLPTSLSSSSKHHKPSLQVTLSKEEREQKLKQATMRASFVQQLVLSTLIEDS